MKQLLVALSAVTFAVASTLAIAQTPPPQWRANDTPPAFTPAQTAMAKSDWDAAKAKWAAMSPAEKAALKKASREKKVEDLNALELVADNDMSDMTPEQQAKYKSERAAAKTKVASMSAEEKAAMKKAARQKKLSDLSTLEREAGSGS